MTGGSSPLMSRRRTLRFQRLHWRLWAGMKRGEGRGRWWWGLDSRWRGPKGMVWRGTTERSFEPGDWRDEGWEREEAKLNSISEPEWRGVVAPETRRKTRGETWWGVVLSSALDKLDVRWRPTPGWKHSAGAGGGGGRNSRACWARARSPRHTHQGARASSTAVFSLHHPKIKGPDFSLFPNDNLLCSLTPSSWYLG